MFGGHCERRARSTGRLHNARAKSVGEDHTTLFGDSDFVASSQTARKKIDEKAFGNRQNPRRMAPKSPKKSISGRLGRPKRFRGRVWTCSGRFLDTQMLPQSRSWGAPGGPRAARRRPKASPGRPRDAPRAFGTTLKTPVSAVRIAQCSWKRSRIDF